MKSKKISFIWFSILIIFVLILTIPMTREIFELLTSNHPYLMGFIKFAILATMGEFFAIRIIKGEWLKPTGYKLKAVVWGFLGMAIVLVFELFHSGVFSAMDKGLLPGSTSSFLLALLTSVTMNFVFAPTMMLFHRISDTHIDLAYENGVSNTDLKKTISAIDWDGLVSFVILKTIPFFWIPVHTIVFLLPPQFRVITAAFLSLALGAILGFASNSD